MDPILNARLRRQWPLLAALVVLVLFAVVHVFVFRPLALHYQATLKRTGTSALGPGPGASALSLPPRVYALLMDNSLPAAEADRKGASGALGSDLVQALSDMAGRHGLEVVVAEPGLLTQQPAAVEVRAHLRLAGSYAGLVGLLDEVARGQRLLQLERFAIAPDSPGHYLIDLYVAGCVLRRTDGRS